MVSTPLKSISQNGNLPQIGVKIKNVWNHHLVLLYPALLILNLTPTAFSTSLISGGGGLARKTGRLPRQVDSKLQSLAANQSCFQLHASFVYDPLGMPECGAILAYWLRWFEQIPLTSWNLKLCWHHPWLVLQDRDSSTPLAGKNLPKPEILETWDLQFWSNYCKS